jgi:hypothetical protein
MPPVWERIESGPQAGLLRCTEHDTVFGALEPCQACPARDAPAPDDDKPEQVAAPEGCATTEEHEREFTALAIKCERLADTYAAAEGGNPSAVTKLIDNAIKARRAAAAAARAREDDAFVVALEKKRAGMGKRGRH